MQLAFPEFQPQCFPDTLVDSSVRQVPHPDCEPDLAEYFRFIVAFSGGKDSIACFLHLLEAGVDPGRIELWHHDIDGREGDNGFLMDWPSTPAYCRAFAEEFGVPISYSWREGGFAREFGRSETPTAATLFEDQAGEVHRRGGTGRPGTRLKFPQVTANLSQRWCSAYLKIDVAAIALRNQPRFNGEKTLILTGERAAESAARSKYLKFEPDRADSRNGKLARHIDHWRPVHGWSEGDVWAILKRHRINPPPAYQLGWGRLSCLFCIFGSRDQWASARAVAPKEFARVAKAEASTGLTIHRKLSVNQLADSGTPYPVISADPALVGDVLSAGPWVRPVRCRSEEEWQTPHGAFKDSTGPT